MSTDASPLPAVFSVAPVIWVLLIVIVALSGMVLRWMASQEHIAINGKVSSNYKIRWPRQWRLLRPPLNTTQLESARSVYTTEQRRWLGHLYSAQAALLGLLLFMLGLMLLSIVYIHALENQTPLLRPSILICLLGGLVAIPCGIVLVYWRNRNNPFLPREKSMFDER